MTDEEAIMTIGALVLQARKDLRLSQTQAAEMMGINYRTLAGLEQGHRMPVRRNLAAVERVYGWHEGAILEFWDRRQEETFGEVSAQDFAPRPEDIVVPLAKAKDLTTEELLAELNFRVMMMSRTEQKAHSND